MLNREKHTKIKPESDTIGEIVAKNYHAAGVFRRHGMDFCCGGNITLSEACQRKKTDVNQILNDLINIPWDTTESHAEYTAWEPDHLIDFIIDNHHRFVRAKLTEIPLYAEKVARVHGERNPENVEIYRLFNLLADELINHMEDEEDVVFPLIREVYSSRINGNPVPEGQVDELRRQLTRMEEDHEEAGNLMEKICRSSNDYTPPEDACATYRILYKNLEGFEQDLHRHVHLENHVLFKKARKLI